MDKPGKPKTITIKINGKERPVEERKIISWESNKTKPQPEAIDELTFKEIAAGQEAEDDSDFDWILPEIEEEDLKEYKIATKKKSSKGPKGVISSKKKGPNKRGILPSILLTVFLAVLFGSSLGVFLLKMVITETTTETGGTPVTDNPPEEAQNPAAVTTSLQLSAITSYVVQGGAFSNMEAASAEESMMLEKGIPAKPIEIEGKAFLFVGLGNSLSNAKEIGTELNSKGIETFAKEVQIGGGDKLELKESEKAMLEMVPQLYESLSNISTTATISKSVSAELQKSLDEVVNKWNGIENIEEPQLLELKSELDGAITNIKNYSQNQDDKLLVNLQQHLLNFLAVYGSL